jgi:hypothetical protein
VVRQEPDIVRLCVRVLRRGTDDDRPIIMQDGCKFIEESISFAKVWKSRPGEDNALRLLQLILPRQSSNVDKVNACVPRPRFCRAK